MFNEEPRASNVSPFNWLTNIWRTAPEEFSAQVTHKPPGPTASEGFCAAWVVSRLIVPITLKPATSAACVAAASVAAGSVADGVAAPLHEASRREIMSR